MALPPGGNIWDTVSVKLAFTVRTFLSRTEGRSDPDSKMGERWGRDAGGKKPDTAAQIPYGSACALLQHRQSPETDPGGRLPQAGRGRGQSSHSEVGAGAGQWGQLHNVLNAISTTDPIT